MRNTTMNIKYILISALGCILTWTGQAQENRQAIRTIDVGGYLGGRIDQCIQRRIMPQDLDHIIEPFRHKTETSKWQSEFWGKWTLGACDAYAYNNNEKLLKKIQYGANELMKTQLSNGYIGNYAAENRLAQWDVWGQKYSLLGLQAYYAITKDKRALESSKKMVDYLLTLVGPGKADIAKIGNYRGLAAGSILEPIVYLYHNTKDQRYLDFAEYIVRQWETEAGPQLISKALNNVPVADRFLPVHKAAEWTLNGHKAYEMMSCYVGLLELYRVVGEPSYLAAAEITARQIMDQELNIVGSASATECFWHGAKNQTTPSFLSNETCVTYTWMQLCHRLYQITGKSIYMDELERTAYNALQASMTNTGSQIASYIPLEGFRMVGERQCGLDINCCEANGPRGFAMLPHAAIAVRDNNIIVNLYSDLQAQVDIGKSTLVNLEMSTNYPISEEIELTLNPEKETEFTLGLRVPLWSRDSQVIVNGQPLAYKQMPGTYALIKRKWKKGDKVSLQLDLTGKLVKLNDHYAITRGPIVLVRDSRFKDGFVDETIAIEHNNDNVVPLESVNDSDHPFAWMSFAVNAVTSIYNGEPESFRKVKLCDFGSAGNTWDTKERYKVWMMSTRETADRETWW